MERIFEAAERLNRANVRAAQSTGTRLYRDAMTAEARALDEAFQEYYDAQRPNTNGPQPLPIADHVEIPAESIGFTLKMDDETKRALEEIDNNRLMAALNADKIVFR